MFNLTKRDIADCGRVIGLTIRWNAEWGEFQVYPKGAGTEHPSAYFTSDGEDALLTALKMVEGQEHGTPRDFTMTEQLDIESSGTHWFNEESHADHPIGDRLEAVGDNVYRIRYAHAGDKPDFQYFYSLKDALNA